MIDSLIRHLRAAWLPIVLIAMLGVQCAMLWVLIDMNDEADYYGCGGHTYDACYIRAVPADRF